MIAEVLSCPKTAAPPDRRIAQSPESSTRHDTHRLIHAGPYRCGGIIMNVGTGS